MAEEHSVRTGHHFGKAALNPVALVLLVVIAGGAFFAGSTVSAAVGLGAAGLVLLIWLMIVGYLGARAARTEFFEAYSAQRGLHWTRGGSLPGATPLLRMGDANRADEALTGALPGGLQGTVALYTYEEHKTSTDGTQATEYHHFTVVLCDLPESRERLPALYAQRHFGFRFLDGAEDVFRSTKRVELESEKLDQKCEIFAAPACDDVWLRRLFSPTFVAFLAEDTPEGFAFEVEDGVLCVNIRRHAKTASALDRLCADAGTVAKRIRDELAE